MITCIQPRLQHGICMLVGWNYGVGALYLFGTLSGYLHGGSGYYSVKHHVIATTVVRVAVMVKFTFHVLNNLVVSNYIEWFL